MLLYILTLSLLLTIFYMLYCSDLSPILAYISYCCITGLLFIISSYIANPYLMTPILYIILVLVVNIVTIF